MSILRMSKVKEETGHASHSSVYTEIHDGLFTVPVLIGQRAVGWPDYEVNAINAARIRGDSDDQIRELVNKLHSARMAGSDEPFKTDWFERSAQIKRQAAKARNAHHTGHRVESHVKSVNSPDRCSAERQDTHSPVDAGKRGSNGKPRR